MGLLLRSFLHNEILYASARVKVRAPRVNTKSARELARGCVYAYISLSLFGKRGYLDVCCRQASVECRMCIYGFFFWFERLDEFGELNDYSCVRND